MGVYLDTRKTSEKYCAYYFDSKHNKKVEISWHETIEDATNAFLAYCLLHGLNPGRAIVRPGYVPGRVLAKRYKISNQTLSTLLIEHPKYHLGENNGYAYLKDGTHEIIKKFIDRKYQRELSNKPLFNMPDISAVVKAHRESSERYWG